MNRLLKTSPRWPSGPQTLGVPAPAIGALVLGVLLMVFPSLGVAAHGGATRATLDLRLERKPVIVNTDYLALPRIADDGGMGRNRRGSGFSLADQRLGDLYVRAGIVHGRADLIRTGFKAFDYAFARQRRNGSWRASQPTEEYAFFVEAIAHVGLLLRQTKYGSKYRSKLRSYKRRTRRALPHMVTSTAWADFRVRNAYYTHSAYTVGTALGLAGRFAGTKAFRGHAREAIALGLSRQWQNGVNPELGGHDVRYQAAGLAYAQRYSVYFPGQSLAKQVRTMTRRGAAWQSLRVDTDGWIDWTGSTRACVELSSTGKPKSPGYPFTIRAFAYWGALNHRRAMLAEARSVKRYLDAFAGSLCEPKQSFSTSQMRAQGQAPEQRVGEALSPTRAQDLLE